MTRSLFTALAASLMMTGSSTILVAPPPPARAASAAGVTLPVEYYKLGNGLKVVLSLDATAPKATVAAYTGFVRKVYTVTPADVQKMTGKYIRADHATIVVAGDRKAVDEQVAPFAKASS